MVLDSTGCRAWGNVFDGMLVGIFYGNKTGQTTGQSSDIDGNTFLNVRKHGVYSLSTADKATNSIRNNAMTAALPTAVSVNNLGAALTSAESNNGFYGFAAASGHTLSASDVLVDPKLSSGAAPLANSPLLGAGVHLGYTRRDFDGKQRQNPPSIGAFDTATLRPDL